MCQNCLSAGEVIVGQIALVGAVLKQPLHRALANAGVVAAPDPAAVDHRTVGFLRSLDLDPVEILGAAAVDRADRYVPVEFIPRWRHARLGPWAPTAG